MFVYELGIKPCKPRSEWPGESETKQVHFVVPNVNQLLEKETLSLASSCS